MLYFSAMSDGKRRLPLYVEPARFDEKEVLALHFNQSTFSPHDCFEDHSQSKTAVFYHFQGLKALNQGYWAMESKDREIQFQTAFGFFHLAHNFDKKYFCTREALSHVAGLVGLDSIEAGERYANSLESTPTIDELAFDDTPRNPHYVCHLLHPGFYSASDLNELEKSLKQSGEK